MKVMGRSSNVKVDVRADGTGLSSRAGTALLPLAAERLGLTDALGWALGETRERRSAHDPGRVFCDLAVMLADGGRCVSDLVALGSQPALFGEVASVSTARRVLLSIGEAELDRVRAARAAGAGAGLGGRRRAAEVILDFDATPITAHSEKEQAAGHYKGGFGFHPLLATCGREVLAAILRPGNAGANNADDHLEVFELALAQLPPAALGGADPRALRLGRRQPRARRRVPRDAGALLVRLRDRRARPRGDPRAARGGVAAARSTATASRARAPGWPS